MLCVPSVWAELAGELLCSALLQQQTEEWNQELLEVTSWLGRLEIPCTAVPLPSAQRWEIPPNVPSASSALGQGSIAPKAVPAPQCPHPNSILLLLLSGCLEICGQSVLLHLLLIWQEVEYSSA